MNTAQVWIDYLEMGKQIKQMQAQFDGFEKRLNELNQIAATPEQIAFETKYHRGPCHCRQCEERRQGVQV